MYSCTDLCGQLSSACAPITADAVNYSSPISLGMRESGTRRRHNLCAQLHLLSRRNSTAGEFKLHTDERLTLPQYAVSQLSEHAGRRLTP